MVVSQRGNRSCGYLYFHLRGCNRRVILGSVDNVYQLYMLRITRCTLQLNYTVRRLSIYSSINLHLLSLPHAQAFVRTLRHLKIKMEHTGDNCIYDFMGWFQTFSNLPEHLDIRKIPMVVRLSPLSTCKTIFKLTGLSPETYNGGLRTSAQ